MEAVISREIAYKKRRQQHVKSRKRDLNLLEQSTQYALAVLLEFPDMRQEKRNPGSLVELLPVGEVIMEGVQEVE